MSGSYVEILVFVWDCGEMKKPVENQGYEEGSSEETDSEEYKEVKEKGVKLKRFEHYENVSKRDIYSYPDMKLKKDHENRPLWVTPDYRIILETFNPISKQATEFLIAISQPISRPQLLHEYTLTPYSLYAAVSVGLETNQIIKVLETLSKNELSENIKSFIRESTASYGKVKLVLNRNTYYIESQYPEILIKLLEDEVIRESRVKGLSFNEDLLKRKKSKLNDMYFGRIEENDFMAGFQEEEEGNEDIYSFAINHTQVATVTRRCSELDFPLLEEYDFRNDSTNPNLDIDLKPTTLIRGYQEKSLSKMFGNGRARSGIICLPCGSGKTLVGITAICTVKKSAFILCTSNVAVEQWRNQLKLWTNIDDKVICRFTSTEKESMPEGAAIVITTYSMVAPLGKRSEESKRILNLIKGREWGILVLDEVHVVPAEKFRKAIFFSGAHTKLGLTATLVREDHKEGDLNFLIGPKLYEANWMDLQKAGHIASVQCAEVWCPMSKEFFKAYMKYPAIRKLLYVMNPNKFRACEYLIHYHEERGDKIIVFADNIYAIEVYARKIGKPLIHGETSSHERMRALSEFQYNPQVQTLFISRVGDNSIDLPDANVIIQISSHYGSRRQEAQRLGRILRPKAGGKGDEFNAFFYTLISQDTQEMYFSAKRQQFLVDQGYSFKVIDRLPDMDKYNLHFNKEIDRRYLLHDILEKGDIEGRDEVLPEHYADFGDDRQAKRLKGGMGNLTGRKRKVKAVTTHRKLHQALKRYKRK